MGGNSISASSMRLPAVAVFSMMAVRFVFDLRRGDAPQSVIAAQFNDSDIRRYLL